MCAIPRVPIETPFVNAIKHIPIETPFVRKLTQVPIETPLVNANAQILIETPFVRANTQLPIETPLRAQFIHESSYARATRCAYDGARYAATVCWTSLRVSSVSTVPLRVFKVGTVVMQRYRFKKTTGFYGHAQLDTWIPSNCSGAYLRVH